LFGSPYGACRLSFIVGDYKVRALLGGEESVCCGLFRNILSLLRRPGLVSGWRSRSGTDQLPQALRGTKSTCARRHVWFVEFQGRSACSK